MTVGTTLTPLYSCLRLYGQTENAGTQVTVKEEDYRAC